MLRPPPLRYAPYYPVTTVVSAAALIVTALWHFGHFDISPLTMEASWWPWQPWRLLTSCLPHVNALHLIFNLYWLWIFGAIIEHRFGRLRTAGLYVLLAAGSSAAEYAFFRGGVGLSGVGYGLFGFLWILWRRDRRFAGVLDASTVQLFVVWFFLCIVLTVTGMWNIANVAHGMGALLGAMVGHAVTLHPSRRQPAVVALVAVCAVIAVSSTVARPYVNLEDRLADAGIGASADYRKTMRELEEMMRRVEQQIDASDRALAASDALDNEGPEKAVRLCREAIEFDESCVEAWIVLAFAYERLGRGDEAAEALAKARQLGATAEAIELWRPIEE